MEASKTYNLKIEDLTIDVIIDNSFLSPCPSHSLTTEDIDRQGKHYHALYEMFFVGEKPLILLNEGSPIVFSDCIVCIPPRFLHNTIRNDDMRILFSFSHPSSRKSEIAEFADSFFTRACPFSFQAKKARLSYMKEISNRRNDPTPISGEIISALFKLVFCDIYETNAEKPSSRRDGAGENYFVTIDRIITDYRKDINLGTVADRLNLSTKQASRIIRKNYKTTLSELICKKRLDVASALLSNSDMPISDIIEHINFPSESYFYSRFKKEYGCTPLKYREANRKKINIR